MGSASNYNFIAGAEGAVCLHIRKKHFLEQCLLHKGHYAFFFE